MNKVNHKFRVINRSTVEISAIGQSMKINDFELYMF